MIINVIQTQRQPKPEFTIENIVEKVHMGEAIAHSYNSTYANIENKRYDFDSTRYPAVNNKGIKIKKFNINVSDGSCIELYDDIIVTKKVLFVPIGYSFFRVIYSDIEYLVYEIGMGNDKHYFNFYENDKLIGIIHKHDRVIDFKDTYTLYFEDKDTSILASVFTIFVDCGLYADVGKVSGGSDEAVAFFTPQKELKEKYDPTFIPRIKALHNMAEWKYV